MTKHPLLFCLAITVALTSCSTSPPKGAITLERLSTLEKSPTLSTKAVTITSRIQQKDSTTTLPVVKTRIGQTVKVEVVNEFPYPTAYDLPRSKVITAESGSPVTPTTPKSFDWKNLGIELQLTPAIRGPYVELTGFLTLTKHAGFGRGAGEPFSVIVDPSESVVLTENKVLLPHFTTDEYRIHIVGLPGREHVVQFDGLQLHLTCETSR